MSEKENNDFKNFYNENPFKKRIILEKVNKPGPIEQKLIIHHKKNLRKSLIFDSKEDFDKENYKKEKSQDLNKNAINKNGRKVLFDGNKTLIFDNLLAKKEDYPHDIKSQKIGNDNGQNNQNSNPFFNHDIKLEEDIKEKKDIKANPIAFNPFKLNNISETEISNSNPFKIKGDDKINKNNPFINLIKDSNNNETNVAKNFNPFKNIENNSCNNANPFSYNENNIFSKNPFLKMNNKNISDEIPTNPFISDNEQANKNNPFMTNGLSNPFKFNANNLKNDSSIKENFEEDEDNKDLEEEVKIEKDEDKLKNLKEVQYSKTDKFYEIEIENLQYLEHYKDKNKYISIGGGIFDYQEEKDENGKNVGIFILRESSTKKIKLQGIIIDSTSVEKAKLKNGLEFIFIKNILVKYSKYDPDKITEETKITYLRIRINKNEIDNFYNKTNEFFNLIKK